MVNVCVRVKEMSHNGCSSSSIHKMGDAVFTRLKLYKVTVLESCLGFPKYP